jgi:hypothetical protein
MRHYDASMKLLMTKFDKAKKTGLSGFDSFMVESRKKAKWGNLMIQMFLRHGKGKQGIMEQRREKFIPEDEAAKTGPSGLGFRTIRIFQNR